ncbi:hypothetical protein GCM10007966_02630 [Legionella impletisoli]|uniref:Periplasmic ligand-binding sensor domain protein n=2 Tax=Legionella impletisoli TaxID=343510 RepID=A0A917JQU7_9GAMM|nr:hypothetical protein GCM10007966_02630 [Legionella impletisoli]
MSIIMPNAKKTPSAIENPEVATYVPMTDRLVQVGWQVANFGTLLVTTSTTVALVQSPLNGLMANFMRYGQALPPNQKPGVLAAVRGLYVGMISNWTGSSMRTAYVTGATSSTKKGNVHEVTETYASEELASEPSQAHKKPVKNFKRDIGYVSAFALGDVLVTQISDNKAQLRKLNVIDSSFNWKSPNNLRKLSTTGFGMRYGAGLTNFAALCLLEEQFAQVLPGNNATRHLLAGLASGMSAAVVSYPFAYMRDVFLAKTLVVNGTLQPPTFMDFTRQSLTYMRSVGFVNAVKEVFKEFTVQAPLRMGRTGATFAIVSGINAALGSEPLARVFERPAAVSRGSASSHGFFAKPEVSMPKIEEVSETSQANPRK